MRRSLDTAKRRRDLALGSNLETDMTYLQPDISTPLEKDLDVILMHALKTQLHELIEEKAIISQKIHAKIRDIHRMADGSN